MTSLEMPTPLKVIEGLAMWFLASLKINENDSMLSPQFYLGASESTWHFASFES